MGLSRNKVAVPEGAAGTPPFWSFAARPKALAEGQVIKRTPFDECGLRSIQQTKKRQHRTIGTRKGKQVSLKPCPAILLYESIYRNKGIQARSQNRFETGCSTQDLLVYIEIFDILDTEKVTSKSKEMLKV